MMLYVFGLRHGLNIRLMIQPSVGDRSYVMGDLGSSGIRIVRPLSTPQLFPPSSHLCNGDEALTTLLYQVELGSGIRDQPGICWGYRWSISTCSCCVSRASPDRGLGFWGIFKLYERSLRIARTREGRIGRQRI